MTDADSTNSWRFSLPNSLEAVGEAHRSLEAFLEGHGVASEATFPILLALEEAATNVIKYAYADSRPHEVALEAELGPDELALRVIDDGREFNPLDAPPPELEKPHEERAIGGLGIHLLRNLARRIEYERVEGKNRVTLFFSVKP